MQGEPGFWSEQVFRLYGLPPSDTAPPIEIVLRQLDAPARACMWQSAERCGRGEADFAFEYQVRTPQGAVRTLRSCGHLTRPSLGEPVIVGTIQDVTAIAPMRAEIQVLKQGVRGWPLGAPHNEGLSERQWVRVQRTLETDPAKRISVRQMASSVNLSTPDFTRRFRITTGETPHQYLLRVRLLSAEKALRDHEKSIAQVAVDCGFFDQSHFTRHFKRRYGLTPARFAEALRR